MQTRVDIRDAEPHMSEDTDATENGSTLILRTHIPTVLKNRPVVGNDTAK